MPPTSQPAWVVCTNTYDFWQAGCELPAEYQLSPDAAAQVMKIKFYAAEQARLLAESEGGAAEGEEEEAAPLPLMPGGPCAAVAGPMAAWATPAVLAQKAAIEAAGRSRASPVVP